MAIYNVSYCDTGDGKVERENEGIAPLLRRLFTRDRSAVGLKDMRAIIHQVIKVNRFPSCSSTFVLRGCYDLEKESNGHILDLWETTVGGLQSQMWP